MHCREKNACRMIRPWLILLVFFIVFLPWFPVVMADAQDRQGPVKEISVAVAQDYPPSYFRDMEGRAVGWMVDIWRLWLKKPASP